MKYHYYISYVKKTTRGDDACAISKVYEEPIDTYEKIDRVARNLSTTFYDSIVTGIYLIKTEE